MDSLISTFHIDWHLIIAQAVNFVAVLLVLYFFALKPLGKLMDERGKTIAGGLDDAEKHKALVEQATADYQAMMTKANAEGMAKIKQATKDAQVKASEIITKAEDSVAGIVAGGQKQLEADKVKMLEDVKREAVTFILSITEKVLGDTAGGKIDAKLVEESIKKI